MNIKNALHVILVSISLSLITACKDAWKEHSELMANGSDLTLKEKIAAEPSLSKFYQYLNETGLSDSLASHKTYTIWAPTNSAIDEFVSANPDYFSAPGQVEKFVRNYITNTAYQISQSPDSLRLKTLNNTYVNIVKGRYEEVPIASKDYIAKNGILNIIEKALPVRESIWNVTAKLVQGLDQGIAMASLDTLANVDGKDVIKRSARWASFVSALSNSSRQYTYFVLANSAYNTEYNKILPYYTTTRTKPDSTTAYVSRYAMITDLLVSGVYTPDKLPASLTSMSGIKIPIDKSAIQGSYLANNGIVYVLNSMPFSLADRIKSFKIEGEKPTSFRNVVPDKRNNTSYRNLRDTIGTYSDIQVYNHGVSEFFINYRVSNVHKVKYKVYSRALINLPTDQQTVAFTQRYGVASPTNPAVTTVLFTQTISNVVSDPPNLRYREVYLGEYTPTQYGTLDWRLLSAASTASGVNTLILDYLRFEPVLP